MNRVLIGNSVHIITVMVSAATVCSLLVATLSSRILSVVYTSLLQKLVEVGEGVTRAGIAS